MTSFRSLSLLALAIVGASPATAADLYSPPPAPADEYYAPALRWSGIYAGINAGYSWSHFSDRETSAIPYNTVDLERFRGGGGGFTGGIQLGYNYQVGNIVLGIEADINYVDISRSVTSPSGFVTADNGSGYMGTLRPKLGLAMGPWLFYGTGGLAYATIDSKISGNDGFGLNATESGWRTGWVAGAGIEYALDRNWSIRTEYLHTDFGRTTVSGPANDGLTYSWSEHARDNSLRVGVNYRF